MQERKSLLFVSFQNVRSPTASTRRRERRRGPSRPWRSCCRTPCTCCRGQPVCTVTSAYPAAPDVLEGKHAGASDDLEAKHAGGKSADPAHSR